MRLHIFGASGTGVTTLGNALSAKLNIPYFDSDDFFWEKSDPPFTKKRERESRNTRIKNQLNKTENWILGGSIIRWGENIFPKFDLVVFLYLPKQLRIDRLKQREFERWGDIIYTDPNRSKMFTDFIAWAADYDDNTGIATRTMEAHELWLRTVNSPVLKLVGDLTTEKRVELIIKKLSHEKLLSS
jgi:adenylate kinase family enzyme